MRHLILAIGACLIVPTTAQACFEVTLADIQATLTPQDLSVAPYTLPLTAGGEVSLRSCGSSYTLSSGYITRTPLVSLYVSGFDRPLVIRADDDACDTLLMVNDPGGFFHSDDDSGGGLAPALEIEVGDGRLDIWVGTYGPDNCASTLTVQ